MYLCFIYRPSVDGTVQAWLNFPVKLTDQLASRRNFIASHLIDEENKLHAMTRFLRTWYSNDVFFFLWPNSTSRALAVSLLKFLNHTRLDTHIPGSTPLTEWSARRRGRYLHNTQQTQETNLLALRGIRTSDPNSQATADPRLRQQGHLDQPLDVHCFRLHMSPLVNGSVTCGDNMWAQRDVSSKLKRCIISLTTSYQLNVLHNARW